MKTFKRFSWYVIYAIAVVFIVYYIAKYFNSFKVVFSLHFLPFLLGAFIANFLAFFVMGSCWAYMVKRHHPAQYLNLVESFYVSQITRYVPGGIWSFWARIENNTKMGISKSATGYFLAIENINLLFTAALFSLLAFTLITSTYFVMFGVVFLVLLASFGTFFFFPDIMHKLLDIFSRKFSFQIVYNDLGHAEQAVVLLFFVVYWILFGISFYIILEGMGAHHAVFVTIIGINAASWLIGYLSLLTPSGIGAREAAAVLMLSTVTTALIAIPTAIIARIIFTLSEVAGLILIVLIRKLFVR